MHKHRKLTEQKRRDKQSQKRLKKERRQNVPGGIANTAFEMAKERAEQDGSRLAR